MVQIAKEANFGCSVLSPKTNRQLQEVVVRNGSRQFVLNERFEQSLNQTIGKDEVEDGSVVGKLESVNIHGKSRFYIYPTLGLPNRLECFFSGELRDKVRSGLFQRIEVTGKLYYKSWDNFPHAVQVKDISVYPEDEDLPDFMQLIGSERKALGGLTVEDFLRKIRHEGW